MCVRYVIHLVLGVNGLNSKIIVKYFATLKCYMSFVIQSPHYEKKKRCKLTIWVYFDAFSCPYRGESPKLNLMLLFDASSGDHP